MNRALVVGIADYGRLNQPLPGCVNDRLGWAAYLGDTLDLGADDLRIRGDAEATKATLLADLAWLLSSVSAGDQRVFFFAGHGARLRRRDPETGMIDDVIDETIVAYPGAEADYESFMLFDADLAALINASGFPSTARLTLILDSCHSGGMYRDILLGNAAAGETPLPRCLRLDDDVRKREWVAAPLVVRSFGLPAGGVVPRVIIAAAKAEQSAWDDRMDDGQRHGAFSYYALSRLRLAPSTFTDLVRAVTPLIGAKFPQTPELLGAANRFDGTMFN